MGKKEYNNILHKLKDSVNLWVLNKLGAYKAEAIYDYFLDSLLCFDSTKSRFISCRHLYVNIPDATSDDLQFVYGEKINGGWYFFKGASIVIPRKIVEDHDIYKPLSYQQLHQIALKEVYGGYLNAKGEINEEWFTGQFEGPGWGRFENQASSDWFLKGKRFKTRKEYFEFVHLEKAKSLWASRDTTKPILQLP